LSVCTYFLCRHDDGTGIDAPAPAADGPLPPLASSFLLAETDDGAEPVEWYSWRRRKGRPHALLIDAGSLTAGR
jgi:hypothetical protein